MKKAGIKINPTSLTIEQSQEIVTYPNIEKFLQDATRYLGLAEVYGLDTQ